MAVSRIAAFQGLKPIALLTFSARLKSCPDTNPVFETRFWFAGKNKRMHKR
jgi:hypothetical protein